MSKEEEKKNQFLCKWCEEPLITEEDIVRGLHKGCRDAKNKAFKMLIDAENIGKRITG